MGEPLRELIFEEIVTTLRGMTGERVGNDGLAWGQYPNDPVVTRDYLDELQVNQCPTIQIGRGEGLSDRFTTTVGGQIGAGRSLPVDIYAVVLTANNVLSSTWLERLWDDIYTTLTAHHTLGGLASTLEFDAEPTCFELDKTRAGFRQPITVHLYEAKDINE